jgi:curved DNA-binding protein CbpA
MAFPIRLGLFKFVEIDHYAVLGAAIGMDIKEIRLRYLTVARILHPDTCKLSTNSEKERANRLLSKLVNPSWESLSREQSRQEFRLLLVQIGRKLSQEQEQITLTTDMAQKLLEVSKKGRNPELEYRSLLKSLTGELYNSLDGVYNQIAQISELNLAYLTLIGGNIAASLAAKSSGPLEAGSPIQNPASAAAPATQPAAAKPEPEPPLTLYIRRAQSYIEQEKYSQAMLDLRDALKQEPDNSTCHGLLGLAYLKENQISMARVHIGTALKYDAKNPIALKAKAELDKLAPKSQDKSKDKDEGPSSGFWKIFGGGGKKK